MEGESGEQVGGELECDIISRVLCARLVYGITSCGSDTRTEAVGTRDKMRSRADLRDGSER